MRSGERKLEYTSYAEALQQVDGLYLEEIWVCDLEYGENEYLHQVDSCIEVAIQKQKEQLSVEALVEDLPEKSDAAREAFLAELALDSKKGTHC
ncbi:hypothetical protein L2E82_11291 [Cichorium intybus]|uniref:Uncharacterized protein n=1 Tax=Cichorium intybus TaxID=13427 RepID=A0ACB9GCS3_CICIN|nr:hypothetical protein L2E82_11291 [Cichorium intybus]